MTYEQLRGHIVAYFQYDPYVEKKVDSLIADIWSNIKLLVDNDGGVFFNLQALEKMFKKPRQPYFVLHEYISTLIMDKSRFLGANDSATRILAYIFEALPPEMQDSKVIQSYLKQL